MAIALIWILGFLAPARFDITVSGTSAYTIVIPNDPLPADKQGALILQKYLARMSGATLPIAVERDFKKGGGGAPANGGSAKGGLATGARAIFLGRTGATEGAYDFSRIKDDGFFIATSGSALFIAGAHGRGTVYGVYDFLDRYLGCKKYSAEPAVVPRAPTVSIENGLFDLQNPAFRYRESYYPMSHDPEYLEWHHLHQFEDLWGIWGHSYFKFVSPKEYYAAHPEYFAQVNGKREPTQLCLSNDAVFRLTVAYLRQQMAAHPDALYWSVSPNDDNGYCTCDLCRKVDEEEGGPTGSLIRFVNRVAAVFPDKIITTLAYGYTSRPPSNTKPAPNVYVMLSSIDAMRNQPLESAPSAAAFRRNLAGWGGITPRLMVWDYTTQFTNYLAPFPDYLNLGPNMRYFSGHSVQGVFEQGSGDTYGDMAEYNSYLQAALLWNPAVDVDSLTHAFCTGYYGAAGRFIESYLRAMAASPARSLDIYGNPVNDYNGFLSPSAIDQYSTLLDQAEAAVASDPLFSARVRRARLPLEYVVLQQGRFYGIEAHGFLMPAAASGAASPNSAAAPRAVSPNSAAVPRGAVSNGAATPGGGVPQEPPSAKLDYQINPKWPVRVGHFVNTATEAGVTELSEGGPSPEAYGAEWKEIFARGWEKNDALGATLTLSYPYVSDYPAKGLRTLTDGVPGYRDFSYNWLCFYGVDMGATIDMGVAQTVRLVHLHFLHDPRHWIFLPKSVRVEVSVDGTNYTTLGSYTYPTPDEDYTVGIDDRRFPITTPVQARFVRVTAVCPEALPAWRPSETKKPMICADEIYVQ